MFQWIKQLIRSQDASVTGPNVRQILQNIGIQQSDSGVIVSVDTALALPAFIRGITLISSSVGRTDCPVYKELPNNGRERNYNHEPYDLLNFKANVWQTSVSLKETVVSSALWSGDGYIFIERDDVGKPLSLHNLDSRNVFPIEEYDNQRLVNLYYSVNTRAGLVVLNSDDVIHVKNLGLHTGIRGVSVVHQLRQSLGKALAIQEYGAKFFKNGKHGTRWYSIPGWLTDAQKQELVDGIDDASGLNNAHKTAILQGGATMGSLTENAQEAQLIESQEASLTDIANILGLSPSWVGGKGYSSYGSLEQDNLNLLSHTLDPWFCRLEAEFNSKLLRPKQRPSNCIEFDRNCLSRGDQTTRIKNLIALYQAEGINFEEFREELNRSTTREGDFIRPSNFQLVGDDGLPAAVAPELPAVTQGQDPETDPPVASSPAADPMPQTMVTRATDAATALFNNEIKRLRTRIVRSLADGKPNLADHHEVIREVFAGIETDQIIAELDALQEEINAVLPEQQQEVMSKWTPTLKLS